jgi:membrane fusion protein (multidrug efflux system)
MDGSAPLALGKPKPARRSGFGKRDVVLLLLGLIIAAGVAWYGHYWWVTGRFLEATDDAYTQADAVTIAPRVAGYVTAVAVNDNQLVDAGQLLARIDDRDFHVALDQARADAAASEAEIGSLDGQLALQRATIVQAESDVASAQAALDFARADYKRYTELMQTGAGSVQRAQQADADIRSRTAALARSRAALDAANEQIRVLQAQRAKAAATAQRAEAGVRQAELNLSYTVIATPIHGAVGDRSLRLGQLVQPGTRIMDIVPNGQDIYVVANFKETQLARMWRGQLATAVLDMLPDVTLRGHVDSLAPGSGAQFALLPPENATGNFTKIVQRVPVKIVLDPADPGTLRQLRPGLSATATVDLRTRPDSPHETLVGER